MDAGRPDFPKVFWKIGGARVRRERRTGCAARLAARSLGADFGFHNQERLQESLRYRVPQELHFGNSGRPVNKFLCTTGSLVAG